MARLHQNNFATNLTSGTSAGATTSPLNSIPSIAAPFYIAFDATNINNHYEVVDCTSKTATNVLHAATSYDHTTAEEVRMVVPAVEFDAFSAGIFGQTADGWQSVSDTWTYASATTINVPAGAATLYSVGDKIKLTQTTDKYFYVVTVADTLLTVTGGSDYTVANAAITAPYYSHQASPVGFPQSFAFTPTGSASGSMTYGTITFAYARFWINGRTLFFRVKADGTTGGSASNKIYISTPITPATTSDGITTGTYVYSDAGNNVAGYWFLEDTGSKIACLKSDSSNWGLGASRIVYPTGFYQI